jgi:hypothetical protein
MKNILNRYNMNLGKFWDWFGRIWVQNLKDMNFESWNGLLEIGKGFSVYWAGLFC